MEVRKGNVLVENIDINISHGELIVDKLNVKKHVDSVINSGVIVASGIDGLSIGSIIGYSKYDGVNVKFGNKKYILLSSRETQAEIISKDLTAVRFGGHNRDDSMQYAYRDQLAKTDVLSL